MKLSENARRILHAEILKRVTDLAESYTEIGSRSRVHPSQVSRICRGQFKTASYNVMQICSALGITVDGAMLSPHPSHLQRKLEESVVALWDRSPEDADRLVKLLKQLQALRKASQHR